MEYSRGHYGRRNVRDLIRKFLPYLVVLVETHCQFEDARVFWNDLGYQECDIVEAYGHSSGIWVLSCIDSASSYTCIDKCSQAISIRVHYGMYSWICSAVYTSPSWSMRELLWEHLANLWTLVVIPWLLLGDFNEVLLPFEVRGGNFIASRAQKFSQLMDKCGLLDLGAVGSRFTWFRRVESGCSIFKRLDRGLSDSSWRTTFHEAYVENLT
ncbi:PREDICTED: uncharacterized protein LOC109341431 [Lupinus angustifolius]|uniref:uncharacterized protein LOC109341431 n=1 Tax=Lupinus angustifolius TaxID=3871 RepID=UPI00092F8285|nr:PREDICTED: uncharacterized protein LOC109341431 [Lupinus angustifolius]